MSQILARQKSRNSLTKSNSKLSNASLDSSKNAVFLMSKKIAQLTKVVYYLNTKHEDTQQTLDAVVGEYEEEITQVISKGGDALALLSTQLAEAGEKIALMEMMRDDDQKRIDALIEENLAIQNSQNQSQGQNRLSQIDAET